VVTFIGKPTGKCHKDGPKQHLQQFSSQPMRSACIHSVATEIVEIVNQIPLLGAIVDLPVGLAVGGTGLVIPPLEELVQHIFWNQGSR
jgi:hypothetical protein